MKFRMKLRWFLIILLLVGGAPGGVNPPLQAAAPALAPPDEVTARVADVSERDYYPAVMREIEGAKEFIVVVMYMFRVYEDAYPGSHTLKLLQALIAARKRGVRVRVILGSPAFQRSGLASAQGRTNETARRMLLAGGVDVRYAVRDPIMHGKLIIVDGAVTITGSPNLTDTALNMSYEYSNLVRSKAHAAKLLKRVGEIKLKGEGSVPTSVAKKVVAVPMRFLNDRKLMAEMFSRQDHKGFDLFLFLWRQYMESGTPNRRGFTLDMDVIAEELRLKGDKKAYVYRDHVKIVLQRLRDRYGLIEFSVPRAANGTFRMARGGLKRPRKGTGLEIPTTYWDYGWSRTLSMRAKVMYLICLAEEKTSPLAPWWTLNQETIARKYTNSTRQSTVSPAILELEEKDILVVSRHIQDRGAPYSEKAPNIYRRKELMSGEQIRKLWELMEKAHGKKKMKDARRLAAMLDRPNSRETASSFIYCIDTWGLEATEVETKEVAKLARQNAYRHVGTVIYRLKRKYGEKGD